VGILLGGLLIHRLGRADVRWQVWLVGIATLLGTCASIGAYATTSRVTAMILLCLFVPVAYLNIAPLLSLTQSLVLPRMRGLSCSLLLFGANVANLALAPQFIGLLSDAFKTYSHAGTESLRWALLVNTLTGFWATYHFWAAAQYMRQDFARVESTPRCLAPG
jgi:MFS family permease